MALLSSDLRAEAPVIYMIGDSTMADKNTAEGNPERGWGQLLPDYFAVEVKIVNRAKDGRSTRRFLNEGHWGPVREALKPGDWVIIQFGHNDQKKEKPDLFADAATDYREFLSKFVKEARAKGAQPVFCTSIYRRFFTAEGKPKATLGAYPESMRTLAAELKVPLIDMNEKTRLLLEELGEEKSKALFLHFAPGEIPFYPEGKSDNTHLSEDGARRVAGLFVEGLREQNLELVKWLKPGGAAAERVP